MITVRKITDTFAKADAMAMRWRVFVTEQDIAVKEEFDEYDKQLPFYVAYDGNNVVGMARLKMLDGAGKIERFGVDREYRGKGVGRLILDAMLADLQAQGVAKAKLSAQVHAIPFYEKSGFIVTSDEYMDAGIPHKDMVRELKGVGRKAA